MRRDANFSAESGRTGHAGTREEVRPSVEAAIEPRRFSMAWAEIELAGKLPRALQQRILAASAAVQTKIADLAEPRGVDRCPRNVRINVAGLSASSLALASEKTFPPVCKWRRDVAVCADAIGGAGTIKTSILIGAKCRRNIHFRRFNSRTRSVAADDPSRADCLLAALNNVRHRSNFKWCKWRRRPRSQGPPSWVGAAALEIRDRNRPGRFASGWTMRCSKRVRPIVCWPPSMPFWKLAEAGDVQAFKVLVGGSAARLSIDPSSSESRIWKRCCKNRIERPRNHNCHRVSVRSRALPLASRINKLSAIRFDETDKSL